jgi:hypothetical protein
MCILPSLFLLLLHITTVLTQQGNQFVNSLLPALTSNSVNSQGIPQFSSMAKLLPADESRLAGLGGSEGKPADFKKLDTAIDQMAKPLARLDNGADITLSSADLNQILKAIPDFVNSLPSANNDLELPNFLDFLKGEGDEAMKAKLANDVKLYLMRVYAAAASDLRKTPLNSTHLSSPEEAQRYLKSLARVPEKMFDSVLKNKAFSFLTPEEYQVVKDYYMKQLMKTKEADEITPLNTTELLSPKMIQFSRLLPPGYNISRIPSEVLESLKAGKKPDYLMLPVDLQNHLQQYLRKATDNSKDRIRLEDLLKVPKFEPAHIGTTLSPYDINDIDSDLVLGDAEKRSPANIPLIAGVLIGVVGIVCVVIVSSYCYHLRRSYEVDGIEMARASESAVTRNRTGMSASQFQPRFSSTMKDDRAGVFSVTIASDPAERSS